MLASYLNEMHEPTLYKRMDAARWVIPETQILAKTHQRGQSHLYTYVFVGR